MANWLLLLEIASADDNNQTVDWLVMKWKNSWAFIGPEQKNQQLNTDFNKAKIDFNNEPWQPTPYPHIRRKWKHHAHNMSSSQAVQLNHQPQMRPSQINLHSLSSVFNEQATIPRHLSFAWRHASLSVSMPQMVFWTNARSTHRPNKWTHSSALFSDKASCGEWAANPVFPKI